MPLEKYKSFLSSFPEAVNAAVEAEHIRADRTFVAAIKGASNRNEVENLVKAYIMRVFPVFASALCKLGLNRQFEIRDIDSKCRQFLHLVAHEAYQERIWPKKGILGRQFILSSKNFADTLEGLRRTPEWKQYQVELSAVQDKLLADLDRQANTESAAPGPPSISDPPTFNWVEAMSELPGVSQEEAMPEQPESGFPPDHPRNQSIQSSSETYDPVWNVRGGGDDPETPRESFKRIARQAVVALGQSFSNPTEAVDAWLSRLHEFHGSRKNRQYALAHWRVNRVLEASAEYCAELGTRFLEASNSDAERTFVDLERQFRESPDPQADLTAIRRREKCLEVTGAELMQPATGVATRGRKRGPKPDHESASRVAEIVTRVAPEGDWRSKVDDVCKALDEAGVPCPTRWWKRDRSCDGWAAYDERANAVKAIEYRLGLAEQRKRTTPETLS